MRRAAILGLFVIFAVALIPVLHRRERTLGFRNFRVVDPGVLYRSGQMTPAGFSRIAKEYQIGTVISLRETKDDSGTLADQFEQDYCRDHGIGFHRLAPADWEPVNGVIPGDCNIRAFLAILDSPATRRPVLIHCFAGIHRTGAQCAVYRVEYNGWSPAEAIAEMRHSGGPRATFADNLLNYLTTYTSRRTPIVASPPAQ